MALWDFVCWFNLKWNLDCQCIPEVQLLLSSGIHFWAWKTEVFLAPVIENSIKKWLGCIQGDLDVETGFWKSLFVLVCKCRVSLAGEGQKGNPVAFVFRLLVFEACKKKVVAVMTALRCSGRRGQCRWGCASLTEVAMPSFFPKLAAHLERSTVVTIMSTYFLLPSPWLWVTLGAVYHIMSSLDHFMSLCNLLIIFFLIPLKVIITVREFFVVIACALLPLQIPSTHKSLNTSRVAFLTQIRGLTREH